LFAMTQDEQWTQYRRRGEEIYRQTDL